MADENCRGDLWSMWSNLCIWHRATIVELKSNLSFDMIV
jgi:hypothetical protein